MTKCPICETDDNDLIRNCELRGMFKECASTSRPFVDPRIMPLRKLKPEKRAKP